MMRFCVILIGLAASAAHSHDDVVLPELPIPVVNRIYPVDDMDAAFRWADRESWWGGTEPTWGIYQEGQRDINHWLVVELSESQFEQVSGVLAGVQQSQNEVSTHSLGHCQGLDGRFGVYLQGWSQGPVDNEFLWTFGAGERSWAADKDDITEPGPFDYGYPNYLLKNRFSVAGGDWSTDTELRDSGLSMRFRFTWVDNAPCAESHTSHANGGPRHNSQHHGPRWQDSPYTDWIPIADLLDGNVATSPPAEPEEPEEPAEPAEPEEPTDNAEVERLQAELDALRGDLSELNGDLSAVRDSVAFLLGEPPAGGVDTVEVVRHDTLLFCPQTDEERRDLFDLFTGLDDDESETDGPAGKAASVKPSSWGAIKALTRRER